MSSLIKFFRSLFSMVFILSKHKERITHYIKISSRWPIQLRIQFKTVHFHVNTCNLWTIISISNELNHIFHSILIAHAIILIWKCDSNWSYTYTSSVRRGHLAFWFFFNLMQKNENSSIVYWIFFIFSEINTNTPLWKFELAHYWRTRRIYIPI